MGQRLVHMASVGEDSVQHKPLSFLVRVTGDRVASGLRQWSNLGLDRERTVPEAPVLFFWGGPTASLQRETPGANYTGPHLSCGQQLATQCWGCSHWLFRGRLITLPSKWCVEPSRSLSARHCPFSPPPPPFILFKGSENSRVVENACSPS